MPSAFSTFTSYISIISSLPPPPPTPPPRCTHLFVQVEFIQLREHPAHAAVSPAHQDAKRHKLLEKAQAEGGGESGRGPEDEEVKYKILKGSKMTASVPDHQKFRI